MIFTALRIAAAPLTLKAIIPRQVPENTGRQGDDCRKSGKSPAQIAGLLPLRKR
jgi:hypothetical protein